MSHYTYELRPFLGTDGYYNIPLIEQRKAEQESHKAGGSAVAGHPDLWQAKSGTILTIVDWDAVIAEAEEINRQGGIEWVSTRDRSEWTDRDGRPE